MTTFLLQCLMIMSSNSIENNKITFAKLIHFSVVVSIGIGNFSFTLQNRWCHWEIFLIHTWYAMELKLLFCFVECIKCPSICKRILIVCIFAENVRNRCFKCGRHLIFLWNAFYDNKIIVIKLKMNEVIFVLITKSN